MGLKQLESQQEMLVEMHQPQLLLRSWRIASALHCIAINIRKEISETFRVVIVIIFDD